MTDIIARLSTPDGWVKPLEWNPYRAETPFGYYHIDDQRDRDSGDLMGRPPFLLTGSRMDMSRHETLADAKSAAQADYAARILSALSLSEADISALKGMAEAASAYIAAVEHEPEKDCWDTETGKYEEGAEKFASDWAWKAHDDAKQKAFDDLRAALGRCKP